MVIGTFDSVRAQLNGAEAGERASEQSVGVAFRGAELPHPWNWPRGVLAVETI